MADELQTVYDKLCASYLAIDDFRTKLLGLLPLATGTGIFLLIRNSDTVDKSVKIWFAPIGCFGLLVTVGLYSFELYGIKKCASLIKTGQDLELLLKVRGQFITRPPNFGFILSEPFASGVIYPAVMGAWTYLIFVFSWSCKSAWVAAGTVFVMGFLLPVKYWWQNRK